MEEGPHTDLQSVAISLFVPDDVEVLALVAKRTQRVEIFDWFDKVEGKSETNLKKPDKFVWKIF